MRGFKDWRIRLAILLAVWVAAYQIANFIFVCAWHSLVKLAPEKASTASAILLGLNVISYVVLIGALVKCCFPIDSGGDVIVSLWDRLGIAWARSKAILILALVSVGFGSAYFGILVKTRRVWLRDYLMENGGARFFRSPRDKNWLCVDHIGDDLVTLDLKRRIVMRPERTFSCPFFVVVFEDEEGYDDGSGWRSGSERFDYKRLYRLKPSGVKTYLSRPGGGPIEVMPG